MTDRSHAIERRQIARWLQAEWHRMTGRHYRIELEGLDLPTLRELQRLTRDICGEHQLTVNRLRMMPWRR